jgi:hypothetical protein
MLIQPIAEVDSSKFYLNRLLLVIKIYDFFNRAKIRNEKTEEYAQFYRSPYAISPRRASSQQGER